jgi:membrane-bound ClpP family serine protease
VRKSFAYSETEALADSAIDLIAKDEQDLLNQVDGRTSR